MDNKEIAVRVSNLSKTFHIPIEASSGIKQKIINAIKGKKGFRIFSPLDDMSFMINKGDFFGIVGRNGSGKSTLLKTIAGIYSPNGGDVYVNGTLVPFIELGVGFNPELTGKENVFLNGALLGFSHREVEAMYNEIVEFAELSDFMEERLKNYSSGMQVRLAFSIAIKAKGDILLLDEVLAVGDVAFQKKCFDYFDELKKYKKTVILVTHDMSAVLRFCTKALLIDKGKIIYFGKPDVAAKKYESLNMEPQAILSEHKTLLDNKFVNKGLTVRISNIDNIETESFVSGDQILFDVEWKNTRVENIGVAIIKTSGEYVYGTNTYVDNFHVNNKSVRYGIAADLIPGEYNVMVGLFGKDDKEQLLIVDRASSFTIRQGIQPVNWGGLVKLDSEWKDK